VVHRDIKPDNIMIAGRHVWVADFRAAIPPRWGTWTKQGSELIARRGSEVAKFRMQGPDTLVALDRNREWKRLLPFPDGARIEGTFARSDFRDPGAPRLKLHQDGTFQAVGAFYEMFDLFSVVEPKAYKPKARGYGDKDPI
jgi:serine/threonine protein kinase